MPLEFDGILIWIQKSSDNLVLIASVGTTKISVIERINLLNCQVVADVCGKSLGILITYDGTPPE